MLRAWQRLCLEEINTIFPDTMKDFNEVWWDYAIEKELIVFRKFLVINADAVGQTHLRIGDVIELPVIPHNVAQNRFARLTKRVWWPAIYAWRELLGAIPRNVNNRIWELVVCREKSDGGSIRVAVIEEITASN